jgi:periplasmic protein TonB
MTPNNILKTDFLDILFDGRNKEYGAYILRKTYNNRLVKAMFIALVMAALLLLASSFKKAAAVIEKPFTGKDDTLVRLAEPKTPKDEPQKQEPVKQPVKTNKPAADVRTVQYTRTLTINTAPPVAPPNFEDPLAVAGPVTNPGGSPPVIGEPPVPPAAPGGGDGGGGEVKPPKEETTYTSVEIQARFKGNFKAYLEGALRYPSDAQEAGQQGIVIIQFIVDKEGNISNIEVDENSPVKYPGLVAEAIRIIKKTNGKWIAGVQNGVSVKSYHQQAINFFIAEE